MLNDDQKSYAADMASLPADQKSACGWYTREECDNRTGGCGNCASSRLHKGLPEHTLEVQLRASAKSEYWRTASESRLMIKGGDEGYKNLPQWKAAELLATQAAQIEALHSALEFARDKLPGLILAVRDAPLGDSLGRANEALANGFQVISNALSNTGKK